MPNVEERKMKYNVFWKYYKDIRNSLVNKIIKTNEAFEMQFQNFAKRERFVIVYRRTKHKKYNTTQKTKKMSNPDITESRRVNPCGREG